MLGDIRHVLLVLGNHVGKSKHCQIGWRAQTHPGQLRPEAPGPPSRRGRSQRARHRMGHCLRWSHHRAHEADVNDAIFLLSAKQLLLTQAFMHHRFGAGEREATLRLRVPVIGGACASVGRSVF